MPGEPEQTSNCLVMLESDSSGWLTVAAPLEVFVLGKASTRPSSQSARMWRYILRLCNDEGCSQVMGAKFEVLDQDQMIVWEWSIVFSGRLCLTMRRVEKEKTAEI